MTSKIIKKIKEKEELEKKKKEAYKISRNKKMSNFSKYHSRTETNYSRILKENKSSGNFNKENSKSVFKNCSTLDLKKKREFMTPARGLKSSVNNLRKAYTPGKDFQKNYKKLFERSKTPRIDKNDKKIKNNKNLNNIKKEIKDNKYDKNKNKINVNNENNIKRKNVKKDVNKKNSNNSLENININLDNNTKNQKNKSTNSLNVDNTIKKNIINNNIKNKENTEIAKKNENLDNNKNIENQNSNNNISSPASSQIIPENKTEIKQLPKTIFSRFLSNFEKIQKFFTKPEMFEILKTNKESSRQILTFLKEQNNIKIQDAYSKLAEFKAKNSPEEYTKPIPNFELGKGGLKAITLLDEEKYKTLFLNNKIPTNDILLVYKIFYQLSTKNKEILKKDDKNFWKFVKNDMINHNKLGEYIKNLFKNFDFSNENIQKIKEMTEGNLDKLTPTYYSKLCPTTGLFIFFIKEILEYTGIFIDRKTSMSRIYKNLEYNLSFYKEKETKIEKLLKKSKRSLFKINN